MPTYEYRCTACNHEFERFHSITAAPIKRCPQCGKAKVKRLMGTGAGVIFKGSGFYTTDYRDASYKESAKADSGSPGGGGEAKAEGKSADKAGSSADEGGASGSESKPAAKGDTSKGEAARGASSSGNSGGSKGESKSSGKGKPGKK
jgi:putative FmdB family regulatory protein